jgi:hypothetical protein
MADSVSQVVSEIIAGDSLTFAQAAACVPAFRGEGTSTVSRISRWAKTGAKTVGGCVVKLEVARFGSGVLTSKAALERFIAALNSTDTPAATTPKKLTPSEQRKAADAANKRLTAAGA